MSGNTSRRRVLQGMTAGILGGLAGCSYVTQRFSRGDVKNTVETAFEPGALSTRLSLETGQAMSFGNEDSVMMEMDGDNRRDVAAPYVSAVFHSESGEELPIQNEPAPGLEPGGVSIEYVDGIGAPTDGEYVCAVIPSLPRPREVTGTGIDPTLNRKLEVYGESGSYEPIGENPYPVGDAVTLLETALENVTLGYDVRGGPLKERGYPVPMQYYDLRHDIGRKATVSGADADVPVDGEVLFVPGNKLFEFAMVELVRARNVGSLSEDEREEYTTRLTDLLPVLYEEYGLVIQYDELLEREDDVIQTVRDVVLNQMGINTKLVDDYVVERITESISSKIDDGFEWRVTDSSEPTLSDPGVTATWVLTGESEIDISDEGPQFEPIENQLPSGASSTFQLSLSVPFEFTTRTMLNGQFPVEFNVSVKRQVMDTRVNINYNT